MSPHDQVYGQQAVNLGYYSNTSECYCLGNIPLGADNMNMLIFIAENPILTVAIVLICAIYLNRIVATICLSKPSTSTPVRRPMYLDWEEQTKTDHHPRKLPRANCRRCGGTGLIKYYNENMELRGKDCYCTWVEDDTHKVN